MRWALVMLALCGCGPGNPLPQGYEVMQMSDGWYLRTNGVALMNVRYASKGEAIGRAYLMASSPVDGNRIKLDAVLEVEFKTNIIPAHIDVPAEDNVRPINLGAPLAQTPEHQEIHRFVWVSFNVYGMPFKGLLRDDVISDSTNTFKLHAQ